jgi:hypothetical protein
MKSIVGGHTLQDLLEKKMEMAKQVEMFVD